MGFITSGVLTLAQVIPDLYLAVAEENIKKFLNAATGLEEPRDTKASELHQGQRAGTSGELHV